MNSPLSAPALTLIVADTARYCAEEGYTGDAAAEFVVDYAASLVSSLGTIEQEDLDEDFEDQVGGTLVLAAEIGRINVPLNALDVIGGMIARNIIASA